MSKGYKRIKLIEDRLRKESNALEVQILDLHEENSNLRRIIDEQMDYIKQSNKEFRGEIKALKVNLSFEAYRLNGEISTRRKRDITVAETVIKIQNTIEDARQTFLGRWVFKGFKKEEKGQ